MRAWERSARQWRMDLKAFVADGLVAAGFAGVGRMDESLRVSWHSELGQPSYVYVPVQASLHELAFISVLDEPLHVPWPSPVSPTRSPTRNRGSAAWRIARRASRARRRSRSAVGANEESNEEDWQRRLAHRAAGVAAVKRSADYLSVTADPNVARPTTPDPTDRTLSKRTWERGVQLWRFALRDVVLNSAWVEDDDRPDQ